MENEEFLKDYFTNIEHGRAVLRSEITGIPLDEEEEEEEDDDAEEDEQKKEEEETR